MSFQVELPKEFLPYIDGLAGANLQEKLRIALALSLMIESEIPLTQAAELSGQSQAHFAGLFNSRILSK